MALKSLFLGVLLLSLCISSSSSSDRLSPDEHAKHDYLRFAEVERHCRPVLSSATVLPYTDTNCASGLKNGLSFEKGDWLQDAGGHAPLMPFDGSDVPSGARRQMDPLFLSTFMLTHVDFRCGGSRAALNASGVLKLSISRKSRDTEISSFRRTTPASSPEFKISPGATKLRIKFEGVYTETAKRDGGGEGERVLCMVGSALLPARSTGGADPWDWAKNSGRSGFLPPVRADDNILLVLRFPIKATLTTRAVLGEMRSTGAGSAAAYFDPVRLVSQLRYFPCGPYQYKSEDLVADACSPLPSIVSSSSQIVGSRGGKLFNGSYPCEVLERYSYGRLGVVTSPSTWQQCRSTTTLSASCRCRSLGPFETDRAADEGELNEVGILLKSLECSSDSAGTERMAVVLRALPPWEDRDTAVQRSGLSGLTLSAEGVWMPSAGKACLVACRGTGDKECHFRMCLYIPMTFSITGRGIVLGQITSVNATAGGGVAHSSLSFQLGLSSPRYWGFDGARLAFEYNYTKVKLAVELLRRSESGFSLRRMITASSLPLIRYPRADFAVGDYNTSLAYLAHELALRFTTAPPSMFRWAGAGWVDQHAVYLEIIFLEQVSDRNAIGMRHSSRAMMTASPTTSEGSISETRQRLINVSAELTAFGRFSAASSAMSLEGVYDPQNGRMHLIGCRDVGLRWPNLSADGDLEEGMDCSIEVSVDYPPTNTQWFIWSTAKVRIASTRDAGDPLHFHTVKLQAVPINYSKLRPDDLNRGIVDGVLGIVLLSASIAAALSQLRHLKTHADVAPYVSLVMLCVQALGFVMPLITGIEALVAKATIRSDEVTAMPPPYFPSPFYGMFAMNQLYRSIDQAVKALSLAAVVVTLRLGQKVHRSRARMLARSPPEPGRVPGDAKVLAYQYAAHLGLFVLVLALNGQAMSVEQHVALLQDLFLLPQVISNALWRINCRPLVESYYMGVTAVRLLPHLYELVRPPASVVLPHEYLNARRAVFSSAWDVAVPAGAVLLGIVVYVQQRWNYAIVSRMGMAEQRKLQHIF